MSSNKDITIYESIQDMELERYRYAASVDPVQGLRETVDLILRAYGTSRDDLNNRLRPTRIIFTKTI